MTALKIFNLFYALKLIDGKHNTFKPQLDEVCSWRKIREVVNDSKENDGKFLIYFVGRNTNGIRTNTKNVLDVLFDNPSTKNTIFYEIPRDVIPNTYTTLFKMIDRIPVSESYDTDLAGKIYEYFIGYGDKTSMSELGAYFTDRHITNFIVNEISPEIKMIDDDNGTVPLMIDPFGGSGGLTLTYTRYMQENYGSYINWETEIENIHHSDLSEDVVKSAALEMFALTGYFPAMNHDNNREKTFMRTNSFQYDYDEHKYQYILTNPPYGGNTNTKQGELKKLKKIEDKIINDYIDTVWAQKKLNQIKERRREIKLDAINEGVNYTTCSNTLLHFAKKFGEDKKGFPLIPANDKEACSLLLFMRMVAVGGTVVGVLKEGIFFDSKYTLLRKALIENYNVEQVISVPSDAFENTTTKTSIIIFKHTGRTKKIIFSDLKVNKYEEDVFELLEEDGEIDLKLVHDKDTIKEEKGVEKVFVCEATFDDIVNLKVKGKCPYSLNAKKYRNIVVRCSNDYELVTLSDKKHFTYGKKSKRKAKGGHVKDDGNYNFYTSSNIIKRCDIIDYKTPHIMIGTGGNSCIHMDSNFSCSGDMILLKPSLDIIYVYNVLKISWDRLIDEMHGSTIKHVTKNMLDNFQIPVPRSPTKLKDWVKKISKPYDTIQQKKQELVALEEKVKLEVKRIGDEERCDMVALDNIVNIQDGRQMNKSDFSEHNYKTKNNIPLVRVSYTTNKKIIDYIKFNENYKKYIIKKGDIVMSQSGNTGEVAIYDEPYYGYSKRNVFRIDVIKFNKNYIYTYFKTEDFIKKINTNGTIISFISIDDLKSIKIPIPRDTNLIQNLKSDFKQIETLQREIKDAESEYKRVLQELADDIKPSTNQETGTLESKVVIKDGSDTEIQDIELKENNSDMEQPRRKNKKKKKKKKHKKTLSVMENSEEEPDIRVVSKKKRKKKVVKRKG
jgi:type I restriction enzyme S subunit